MKKKILSIMLALCMVLTMLPITKAAAAAATYDLTQGSVTIDDNSPENITINGNYNQTTANTIQITGTKNHNVTLNEVEIKSTNDKISPVTVDSSGTIILTTNGTNILHFGPNSQAAALRKTVQGTLVIAGSGTLSVTGGYFSDNSGGAAIGGNDGESTANIIIQSGTVQASSLSCAAAIGGGNMGSATNIQITGGNVFAESSDGAAIGGGGNNLVGGVTTYTGRNIVISGGTVEANAHEMNKCMAIGDGNVGSSDGNGMDTSGWGNVLQPSAGMVSKVEYDDNGRQTSFDGNYGTNQKANITRFGHMYINFLAGHQLTVKNGAGSGLYLTGKPVNILADDAGYVEFSKWTLNSGSAAIANTAGKSTTLTMGNTDVTVTAVKAINYDSLKFALSPVSIKGESGKTQQFTVGASYNGTALTADQMAGLSYSTAWNLTDAANSTISGTGLLSMGTETANIKVNAVIQAGGKTYPVGADVLYKEAEAGDLIISGGLPGTDYTYADNVLTFTGSGTYLVGMKPGVTTAGTRIVVNGGSPKITLQNVKISMDSNAQSIFCVLTGSPSVTISGTNSLINYNGNDSSNGIRIMNGHLTLDGGDSDTLDAQGNYYSVIILRGGSLTIKGGHYLFGKSSYNIGSIKVDYNATCEILGGIMELQPAYQGRDCNVITADGDFRIIPAEGKQAAYKVKDSTKYLTEPYSTGTVKFYKTEISFSDSLPAITAVSTGAEVTSAGITVNGTSSATGYYRLYEDGVSSTPLAGDIMGSAAGTVDLSKDTASPVSLTGLKEGTAYDCCIVAAAGSGESTQVSKVVKVSFTTQLNPMTASFDKYASSDGYKDISVTLSDNTLSGIKNGSAELVKDADYTVSGSTVTIKKEYLATLATGDTMLTFHFSTGEAKTLTVGVTDSTPGVSTISPTSANFDKNKATQSDITVTMTLSGNTLTGIKNGGAMLEKGTDYTVSGSTVTIKKEYLADLKTGNTKLVFHFSMGADQTLTVAVTDSTPGVSMISPTSPSLPSYAVDEASHTEVILSSASFPSNVTGITLSMTLETENTSIAPQTASVFQAVTSSANFNIIGSPFLYNLKLLDQNGNTITGFTGTVKVRIPLPAGLRGTPRVFRYEESTGTLTDMNALVENGFLMFSTTHFSNYIVAGTGNSITLDTKSYQMPVNGRYQIGIKLTGSKAATVKVHSTNDRTATAAGLTNGNVQVNGKNPGTVWIMIDLYDNKNHLLTHASVRVDVKTGIRPRGDSSRQIGLF